MFKKRRRMMEEWARYCNVPAGVKDATTKAVSIVMMQAAAE
jgi:hypothetical protein